MRSRSASLPFDNSQERQLHHQHSPLAPEARRLSLGNYSATVTGNPLLFDSSNHSEGELESSVLMERGVPIDRLGVEVVHTLRGASYKLFRFHLHDWLAIFGLAILDGILNIIHPFRRYVGQTMIGDFMYPLKSNTIPFQAVPVIALVIPLIVFFLYFLYSKDLTDLHHATLGVFFAVLITAVITDSIKDAVGRPRPDFFWRCFPDGIAAYNNVTLEVICHGDAAVIKEGHKSFPSGHTSWSFAGLGFLSLYLAGKLQLFNGRGHVGKLAIVFTPLLAALLVGLSRVDDYWHHWQDVFAGAFIGFMMAVLSYHHMYPSIFGENSMGPYSYLEIGNNFKLACFSWFPSRKRHADWPPTENGSEIDMENPTRVDSHRLVPL